MKKYIASVIALLSAAWCFGQTANLNPVYLKYIDQYRAIAVAQQSEHRIPASISMAQGLLESGAGRSELAVKANNHFGIKCTPDWNGASYRHDDDKKNECFRKYRYAEDSWEDHSKFLLRKRYESLFALDITDYCGWANGLKQCGYATDSRYAAKLIKLIEDYHLDALTAQAPAVAPDTLAADTVFAADTVEIVMKESLATLAKMDEVELFHEHRSGRQNGIRYIVAQEGESFTTLSYFLNIAEKTLRRYNDATDGRELNTGDRVYIFPKRRRADRHHARYYVRKGDTAWSIAQKFGIKMQSIYQLNGIPEGTPLVTRQELILR